MSSPGHQQSVSRHKPLTVHSAIVKLLETSKSISTYGEIKPKESTRVEQAFLLMSNSPGPDTSKTEKRRETYRVFLQRVNKFSGSQAVILCAVGLGQSAVSNMKGKDRLQLPTKIKMRRNTWTSELLHNIALKYSPAGPIANISGPQLLHHNEDFTLVTQRTPLPVGSADYLQWTNEMVEAQRIDAGEQVHQQMHVEEFNVGPVYRLTVDDARAVILSNDICGEIWMSDPFDIGNLPFIVIPISKDLSSRFATERPQRM